MTNIKCALTKDQHDELKNGESIILSRDQVAGKVTEATIIVPLVVDDKTKKRLEDGYGVIINPESLESEDGHEVTIIFPDKTLILCILMYIVSRYYTIVMR
jgi:hypothetical protein